jgi:hypothetical protein
MISRRGTKQVLVRLVQDSFYSFKLNLVSSINKRNEILDNRILIKEIIKIEAKLKVGLVGAPVSGINPKHIFWFTTFLAVSPAMFLYPLG